jgi:FdhD protein
MSAEKNMPNPQNSIQYQRYNSHGAELIDGEIIVEAPVSLTVNGEAWLTFMCTPVDLEAMAVGFLYNEGLIESMSEVVHVRLCEHGDNLDVWLTHQVEKPSNWRRTSGCTGGITAVEDGSRLPHALLTSDIRLTPKKVGGLIELLLDAQNLYRQTGGVHTSALSDGEKVVASAEDIGRHNSLDKIAGLCLMKNRWPKQRILLTTGRVSSEMLQKAARIGASVVISRTSPSSLSIQMAERWGITLIGYARRSQFNVYTHPERIGLPEDATLQVVKLATPAG